jgi:hypothetical protein
MGIVAFVKFSGVSRLYDALKAFQQAGGTSILAVGIDHKGTSKEGLKYLRDVVNQVFVYHDNSPLRRTFHSKLYIFEQKDTNAILLLGSGNLTAGGLFTNYESHVRVELDLSRSDDQAFYREVRTKCEAFFDISSGCVRELTEELYAQLQVELPDESVASAEDEAASETEAELKQTNNADIERPLSQILKLFGSSKLSPAPRADISLSRQRESDASAVSSEESDETAVQQPSGALRMFWKTLSSNDVSTTSSPGQIVIPLMFRSFFEPLPQTKAADAGGKGRQWDSTFRLDFADGTFIRSVQARCIVYEPETGHPRQNTECRFTFRDQAILERLSAGDIIVFQQTGVARPQFRVERYAPSDARVSDLVNSGARFGWLS